DPSDRSNPSQASHKPSDPGQPGQQNASQPSANEQPTDGQQTQNGPGSNANSPASRTANLSAGGANAGGGGDWGGAWLRNFDRLLNDQTVWQGGPITGGNYGPWADRLRDIEEVLEFPDLRNQVATARERARLMRQDFK